MGIFKNGGTILSEEEQENELSMLNPFARPINSTQATMKKSTKNSYLNNVSSTMGYDKTGEDEEEDDEDSGVRGYTCSNSSKHFTLPYWSFVFSDVNLRDYVCVQMNVPSGLCDPVTGLQDKVEVSVSQCKIKLIVACEWPETLMSSACMEDALSGTWSESRERSRNNGCTVSNMLQAFKKELHKVRTQNKLGKNCALGSTCTIDLPFQVESDMVVCEPNWDASIGSVNLYVVLKKQSKNTELYQDNRMRVRMTNALQKEQQNVISTLPSGFYNSVNVPTMLTSTKKQNYINVDTINGTSSSTTFDEYQTKLPVMKNSNRGKRMKYC
jgi:hypothetical protein